MVAEIREMSDSDDDPNVFHLAPGDRSLAGTTHEGRDFMFAVLRFVDMSDADFYWGSFQNSILQGAIMERCDLRGAIFNQADMRGINLRHANLGLDNIGGRTQLHDVDLSGADLRNAAIGGADFTGARLVGADLRGATASGGAPDRPTSFRGADLTGAKLGGADLTAALYDEQTRFPIGFKPQAAGMVAAAKRKPRR
jgi:uncharacterized protein YjbI with pentapeptide repeats